MKNVYKSLFETVPICGGILLISKLIPIPFLDIVIFSILFFSVWGKSYQYWTEIEKKSKKNMTKT